MTLRIEDLSFAYAAEPVLQDVSLSVQSGSILALLGPNGIGKSTLLKAVAGIVDPDRGTVTLDGTAIGQLSRRERARQIAYVPQAESPTFASSVFQAVLLGRTPHTSWRPTTSDRERVGQVLEKLDLTDLATRQLDALSQGQRQKVTVARVLVQDPAAMLLDEPTASLDLRHRLDVLDILREQIRTREVAGCIAMHDIELAARFADEVALLRAGTIFDRGAPESVLTADSLEAVYGVEAAVDRVDGRFHVEAIRSLPPE
ncbi:MAG: ABC transporter ATP-binding protein [Halodesulfurarchaeum sp.]|nr:ABC transporter ATP-binding protein [Halodesulfurarchaeum sp.]